MLERNVTLQPKPEPGSGAWSNAQQLVDVNSALLDNFLNALPLANLTPKCVLLQTGAKNYGVHLGRARSPYVESDPRVTLEPNFYYLQEDILWKYYHRRSKQCRDECAAPPRSAVLESSTANQKFNASDGCPLPVNRLWPELARWYGISDSDVGRPETDESKYTVVLGAAKTPLGPENAKAWKEIMKKDGVTYFGFTGYVDTLESLNFAYDELYKLKMLPPLKAKAQPLT
ncbi:hypothetical protein G7Y89_g11974 [Cudoniella acicularis]|uniref:Uncharacterized protein n=1 Tax=Cudoniella acicularis TaxID=354080 RepID=A0A8H4RAY9_9HELO|nr:hypothetical protein G7Y89_g11974 [Cudoniella acicularis]